MYTITYRAKVMGAWQIIGDSREAWGSVKNAKGGASEMFTTSPYPIAAAYIRDRHGKVIWVGEWGKGRNIDFRRPSMMDEV